MPTFDTPDPVTAIVELPIGELRVVASERDDTSVDVLSSATDRAMADDVRVELVGDELRVTGPSLGLLQKLTPRTPGRSLQVEIGLPAGSASAPWTPATATCGWTTPRRRRSPSATATPG